MNDTARLGSFGYDMLDAIDRHCRGFADAAQGNLGASVEHCGEWRVADLVWHLTGVHWFWATIVESRLEAPPDESARPARPADDALVGAFESGARHLVQVLGAVEPSAHVWTWAPAQQDAAFVVRHQVQEAAVHHWDARHAAGGELGIEPLVAADAVDEFLTFSVSSDSDPADPARPALDGAFVLRCDDTDMAWTIADGKTAGTVAATRGVATGVPTVSASASDLLLWLYGRVALPTEPAADELLARFRALTYTD